MREQERAPDIAREDRYHLCFALGKALEDRAAISRNPFAFTIGGTC